MTLPAPSARPDEIVRELARDAQAQVRSLTDFNLLSYADRWQKRAAALLACADAYGREEEAKDLASVDAPQPRQVWQPIETAPTDEDVLLYFPTHDAASAVLICHQFEDADGWYHQNADQSPDELTEQPTHWMPLPSPPQAQRAPSTEER